MPDQEIAIKLQAFDCHCQQCGHRFTGLDLPDFEYGRRIFRTKSGKSLALWVGYEDPVYGEFKAMLQQIDGKKRQPRENAELFDLTFGITCDPINGEAVDPAQRQVCPACNSGRLRTFDIVPKRLVKTKVHPVTHTEWLKRNPTERQQALRAAFGQVVE
jgi:hypothetical protein